MFKLSFTKGDNARIIAKVVNDNKNKKNKKETIFLYLNTIKEKGEKTIINLNENKDTKFECLPNKDIVERIYVSGPSGCGKSYFVGKWCKNAKKMLKPKPEIYIISSINDDDALDVLDPIRVDLDDDLYENPINEEEIEDSVIIFDDIDTMKDKKMRRMLQTFRDFLLEQGRHFNIRVIMTSHLMFNYKETRISLNEATAIVFYPRAVSHYHLENFLKMQGFKKTSIDDILLLNTRWIALYTTYPKYLIWETGACLASDI